MEKLNSMGTIKNHSRHLIGYMILSVTGFRREVGVISLQLYFVWLYLRIIFIKKVFYEAMSRMKLFYSLPINTSMFYASLEIKAVAKLSQAAKSRMYQLRSSFYEKSWTESYEKVELNLWEMRGFWLGLSGCCSRFYFLGWIIWLCSS